MAGSLTTFSYTTNRGTSYNIVRDESAGESSLSGAIIVMNPPGASLDGIPRNIRPRYVNTVDVNIPARRKRFTISSRAIFDNILSGSQIEEPAGTASLEATWRVTGKVEERERLFLIGTDTGLTDDLG